jgi:hypothetical protein
MVFGPAARYDTSRSLRLSRVPCEWYALTPFCLFDDVVSSQGLQLVRENLAHEKYLEEARARVKELEAEVADLRAEKQNPAVLLSGKNTRSWFRW